MMGVTVGCSVIILRKYRGVCNWRTPFQSRFQALKPSFIEFLELSLVHVYSVESNSAISWAAACQVPAHGILQARILDWVAISSSRGSFGPRDLTQVSGIGR